MSKPNAEEHRFIQYLESLLINKDGAGAMANLRRGLGKQPGTVRQMDRYVIPFLPADIKLGQDEPYYLVAALFAHWYQGRDKIVNFDDNLGESLRRLVTEEAQKPGTTREDVEKRLEKRLVALLNCHRDDLPDHLRQIISLLKSKDIPINWAQLLHDIKGWNWENREVQRSWSWGFWAIKSSEEQTEEVKTTAAVAVED